MLVTLLYIYLYYVIPLYIQYTYSDELEGLRISVYNSLIAQTYYYIYNEYKYTKYILIFLRTYYDLISVLICPVKRRQTYNALYSKLTIPMLIHICIYEYLLIHICILAIYCTTLLCTYIPYSNTHVILYL